MKNLVLTAALGASCLALAACGDRDDAATEASGTATEVVGDAAPPTASATTVSVFPKGARIVEEGGVTYRTDADGTRVALTDRDSRIVVEGGRRFRVDPDGTRVEIDERGVGLDIDLPDVDVGINSKGNPDIDIKAKNDGNAGPD